MEVSKSVKHVKRLFAFLRFFRNFIPKLKEHLIPFYKLSRKNVLFELTNEILQAFKSFKQKLPSTATQTGRPANHGSNYAIFCDPSYPSSSFALTIEDSVEKNEGKSV